MMPPGRLVPGTAGRLGLMAKRISGWWITVCVGMFTLAVCSGGDGGESGSSDQDGDGVSAPQDCDDADPGVYPDATEIPYDGVDQDCDGMDLKDVDGDGYAAVEAGGTDCDDEDADVNPGGEEVPYDGVDQDCDGADLLDADGDGYEGEDVGGDDCDDTDPLSYPGAVEIPYDRTDQDCDGDDLADVDGDGYDARIAGGEDCDDRDPSINPDAEEVCDESQVDHDCDGATAMNEEICFLYPTDGSWQSDDGRIVFTVQNGGTWMVMTQAYFGSCIDETAGCSISGGSVTETMQGEIFNSYGSSSFFLTTNRGNCWGSFDSVDYARGSCTAYSETCWCDATYDWEAHLVR